MFRPGDDPTPLDATSVETVLSHARAAFLTWRAARLRSGQPAPDVLIAFGSFGCVPSRARTTSDVDIAVAGPRPLGFGVRLDLATLLGEATGREIDVVDLGETEGPLLHSALNGRVLFEEDVGRRAALLSRYWLWKEDFGPLYEAGLAARRAALVGARA
jgi:predicted nucleotidyltransferase